MKSCTACGIAKNISCYYSDSRTPGSYRSVCKNCMIRQDSEYRVKNIDSVKDKEKQYYKKNKGIILSKQFLYYEANPERVRSIKNVWRANNKANVAASSGKHRASKLMATPSWCETSLIKELYVSAADLTSKTGIQYHVDHIVPLRSALVCGLHCLDNLQLLPAHKNQPKSNKIWPGMEITYDFNCAVCGDDLGVHVCADGSGFNIKPCESCLSDVKNDGYRKGEMDAQRDCEYH